MAPNPPRTNTRVVLLNGPPQSGKDTAAKHLDKTLGAQRVAFADPAKTAVHAAFGLFGFRGAPCPPLAFEAVKDEGLPDFLGVSPRAAYIAHAEHFKKQYGFDVFGRMLLRTIDRYERPPLVAVPDSGFVGEAWPLVEALGAENLLLVRIHADGRGKSFANDSRSHIDLPGVATVDIYNDTEGEVEPFLLAVEGAVRVWLAGGACNRRAA